MYNGDHATEIVSRIIISVVFRSLNLHNLSYFLNIYYVGWKSHLHLEQFTRTFFRKCRYTINNKSII